MAEMSSPRPWRDPERAVGSGCSSPGPGSRSSTPRPGAQSQHQQPLGSLRCCCGQTGCIYLKHNCTVLESVENDVRTAAKLGQSLLERHEAYMADAERDRAELINRIEQLEMDKKELEAQNAHKIQENRSLLDQLESLNTTVSDSDTHIKMLEASLQSSQQTIRRLEGAAERAEDMERHLAALEAEQAALQNTLVTTESEARSAVHRWKRAERGIADLQFQLEKMEKETQNEHERHMDVIGRMERQRALEKELNTAAGRLKGAAAAKSLHDTKPNGTVNGNGVVSHFVRDLLQDNANLQLGMAELRDMLMTSNDEIQLLRDQLMFHQPMSDGDVQASAASTLRAELGSNVFPGSPESVDKTIDIYDANFTPSPPVSPEAGRHRVSLSQEFHIHHHYHVSHGSKKSDTRRPKKKRAGLTPTVFTPPPAVLSLPSTPASRSLLSYQQDLRPVSPGSSPPRHSHHMSRDSISTVMSGPSNRWSLFSDQPSDYSSPAPSSPRTDARSSIFDRTIFSDISMPASPTTSVDPLSPTWRASSRMSSVDESLPSNFCQAISYPLSSEKPTIHEPIMEDDELASSHDDNNAEGDDARSEISISGEGSESLSAEVDAADESVTSDVMTPTPTQPSPFPSCENLTADDSDMTEEDEPYELPSRRQRPLHRAVSLESIVSLQGGLDIHTLKTRPSQLTLRPLGTAMADIGLSSITARPVISRGSHDTYKSNTRLRDSLYLGVPTPRTGRVVSSPVTSTTSATVTAATISATAGATASSSAAAAAATISGAKRLGKFVAWRPWNNNPSAPTAAATTSPENAAAAVITAASTATPTVATTTSAVAVATAALPDSDKTLLCEEELAATPRETASPETSTSPSATSAALNVPFGSANPHMLRRTKSVQHSVAAQSMHDLNTVRSPGINQPGAIPGFFEYWTSHQRRGAPSKVHADIIDEEALREGLLGP
ncbi:hypothetical protein F503_03569 [Ophiostoma piceae UAMH 11346]|uniref:Uncharacterized protein n=1 Tax=Ophiostoma piceae (strain UAMH 11346) TaxID=1262450 RepID=S3BVD2_OPHP1|nr:hypothetical protein F503_03569 [Ophiostoma piceae UAMH 11346]